MDKSKIDAKKVTKEFDYFVAKPKIQPHLIELGDELVKNHDWICFQGLKALPQGGKHGVKEGYTGFASPKAAKVFLLEKRFPIVKSSHIYCLGSEKETRIYMLYQRSNEELQRERDWRAQHDFEKRAAKSSAMIAQKVLGEGVFAMVRKARAMRMGVTA